MSPSTLPLIDAHLDMAWNALSFNRDQTEPLSVMNGREQGMEDSRGRSTACVSVPAMRAGNVGLCLTTILARAKRGVQPPTGHRRIDLDFGTPEIAFATGQGQLAYYNLLEQQGHLRQIRTAQQLDQHWQQWTAADASQRCSLPVGYILSMEGADPVVEPAQAESWFTQGLRSLILAHYGPGHYAGGTGETNGLTPRGFELLRIIEPLGMIVDMTHTTDQGFDDIYDHFGGPLMASHSNCRALVPAQRQLNDHQIQRLLDRRAVIGIALDAWMLRPNWIRGESQPEGITLETAADHIDHICQMAGNCDYVGLGSDLDGGFGAEQRPTDIDSIGDQQKYIPILRRRGYSEEDIAKICFGNWLRFFREHLP